jgi:hypothetical protein
VSDDEAIVRCVRIDQLQRPIAGSEIHPCSICGRSVWLDPALVDEITAELPGHRLVIRCRECVDERGGELRLTPGQVRRLRADGADDESIAQLFAAAELAGATGSMDQIRLEILAFPHGETARRFRDALDRARVFVAMTTEEP